MGQPHRTEGQPRSGGSGRGPGGVEAYIDEPYLNGVLSGILLGIAALWALYIAYSLLRSGLRAGVDLEGWEVREAWRGRLVATRGSARVVLVGGLRPRAVLYLEGRKRGRRPLEDLDLDAWVAEGGAEGLTPPG